MSINEIEIAKQPTKNHLVVDTVGTITLPDGETCEGVILTGARQAVAEAAKHWAGRVYLVSADGEASK